MGIKNRCSQKISVLSTLTKQSPATRRRKTKKMVFDTKQWLIITLVSVGAIGGTAYLSYMHGANTALQEAKKESQQKIDSLNKKSDSIQLKFDSVALLNAYIFRRIDTLNGRDSILKNLLLNVNHERIITKDKYAQLKYIDDYNSDSLRNYFKNNFDSTINLPR
jgi:hypothetical protein